ncbi:helix-turn-helix domain-containing protein [uncultured Vibrio sp.]|uniref:AraC family transcriptional regulator n=1 Tax=uncultured Vibrio sp. TaxID=114054 RepID=UPI0025DB7C6F|nr:AraC family transcriptional regulator [uncultured Vibrio sp.]
MMNSAQVAFDWFSRHSRTQLPMLAETMTNGSNAPENSKEPYVIVPEFSLLAPLPEHQRKRFETALYLMHETLADRFSWEQIAQKSAISACHFHRQFTELFNETPGQYLSRFRLQYAVGLLMINDGTKITDIAHASGYSSSQAMAKALKRELGVTAKAIRDMTTSATPRETSELLNKLAHPAGENSLENQLAKNLPCELIWYPERGIKKLDMVDFDWDVVFETLGKKCTHLMSATPIAELDNQWKDISCIAGDWQAKAEEYDHFFNEGYYLCCTVYLVTDVAYSEAIEKLFEYAEEHGHPVDLSGSLIEMVHDVELSLTGGATFTFQIPIES